MPLSPLILAPIFKPKAWGGRRLAELLGKDLPPGQAVGESWELADLDDDVSVVAAGPARGRTLRQMVAEWGADLLGDTRLTDGRFPLLLKYLDASAHLSVQVHPDAAAAARRGCGERPKYEAWYVVAADPGAVIYRGLQPGVDRAVLAEAIARGTVEELLLRIPVRAGQCYYLPGGVVHALGAGVVVAEVQTPSDVTFRLYDWDRREESTGQPRELHVQSGLDCARFEALSLVEERRTHMASVWTTASRLITSPHFIVERVTAIEGLEHPLCYPQLVAWMVLEGEGTIVHGPASDRLDFGRGQTILWPAGLGPARLITRRDCKWIEVTVPAAAASAVDSAARFG